MTPLELSQEEGARGREVIRMANLIPYRPFRELLDLEKVFDRFFDHGLFLRKPSLDLWGNGAWSPAIDIRDKKDRLVVKAELPGIEKKDLSVKVDGDTLTIKRESKKEQEAKEKDYYYTERSYGSFSRTVSLPTAVQKQETKASYKDGILTVELPKSKETLSKETDIPIQ